MSSSEQRLQEEIEELRGDLGETVEALVHKADVPARAKERGNELAEQAVERGVELQQQMMDRGSELSERVIEWCTGFQAQVVDRVSELRDQVLGTAERARETASQAPAERWIKLGGAGVILLTLMILTRRRRA
jgi:hypothetical protein